MRAAATAAGVGDEGGKKKKRLVQTGVQFPPQPTASVRASMEAPIAAGLLD